MEYGSSSQHEYHADPLVALHNLIKELDRYLHPQYLKLLSSEEAKLLLDRIQRFHELSKGLSVSGEASMDQSRFLIVVGCRLCSDLSTKIQHRLVELLDEQEQEMTWQTCRLRRQMEAHRQTQLLLGDAQSLRNANNAVGETQGLGVIL